MKHFFLLSILLGSFFVSSQAMAKTASANIKGTTDTTPVEGKATFEETKDGLKIKVEIQKAPPGTHGFHVHEHGDCRETGKAAGDHFNPEGVSHGYLPKQGLQKAHAGDFGNVVVKEDGTAEAELEALGLKLNEGRYSVVGRAVILHENPDDLESQPAGNAGNRIGCGIIQLDEDQKSENE